MQVAVLLDCRRGGQARRARSEGGGGVEAVLAGGKSAGRVGSEELRAPIGCREDRCA